MKNSWKKAWEGVEMDQEAREARKRIKRRKVRENRHNCKQALHNENYDKFAVFNWENLTDKDLN